MKYNNIQEYIDAQNGTINRSDIKDLILRSALNLLSCCSTNFNEDPKQTEETAEPLHFLNDILDQVE